jgi:hypothetical protein
MSVQPIRPHEAGDLLTDPHARLSAALVLSLALWAPFGMAALRSDLDVVEAGLRYLVAFLGCRLAVSGIAHLVASYRDMQAAESPDVVDVDDIPAPRRATDAA